MSWGVGRRTEVTAGNSHRCARSTATKLEAACRPTLTATMRACWPGHVVARVRLTERVVGRYTLGHVAGTLVHCGVTGYLASVRCLKRPTSQWAVGAAPLSAMAVVERQIDGTLDAVIQPTIVRPRHGCSPLLVPSACAYLYALHVPPGGLGGQAIPHACVYPATAHDGGAVHQSRPHPVLRGDRRLPRKNSVPGGVRLPRSVGSALVERDAAVPDMP